MRNTRSYEFDKTLVCSTSHITIEDQKILEAPVSENSPLKADYEYGWIIWVGEALILNIFSEAFTMVLKKAKELGCNWIRLDQDGPTYYDFEEFEW